MAEEIEMTPDECGGYHCTRDEHVDCLEGMRRQRDDLSDEMERCHEMLNRRDGIEPGWTSMETLEDRLKTLLDESAAALRAEREARERAVADRDHEWWQALALNDAVAPTPEAVKRYVLAERELAEQEARRERDGCKLVAHDTGDGWALLVEDAAGELVAYLDWPKSWPPSISRQRLWEAGFEVL